METMIKICPNCSKRFTASAVFCSGCGTNLQGVAPVQTQATVAVNQATALVSNVAGTLSKSAGKISLNTPIKNFIPLITTLITLFCYFGYDLIKPDENKWVGYTFARLCDAEFFEEIGFFGVISVIFIIFGTLLSLGGAVLQMLEKPLGNLISIAGSALIIVQLIIVFISTSDVSYFTMVPTFGGIVIILLCLATLVYSAVPLFKTVSVNKTNN